jgi:glycosyltransferase involved in cell wall biosynthesis
MKVLFISDFNINQNPGGAQVSNESIISFGRSLGHEITLFDYQSSPIELISRFDIVISSNLEVLSQHKSYIFDFIFNHDNHVRLEHDSCSYLNNDLRKKLFCHSKKNFFLSNFHIDFFKKKYGNYFSNIEIVYDPIDCSKINNSLENRKYDITYAGFLHPLKGCDNLYKFAKENPNREINIFGWSYDDNIINRLCSLHNIIFHGKKTPSEIFNIYSQSKYIYHNPVVNEPFCRMVAEALLCGCDFIGDKTKIGSIQEFEKVGYEKFKYNCENASKIFWEKLKI